MVLVFVTFSPPGFKEVLLEVVAAKVEMVRGSEAVIREVFLAAKMDLAPEKVVAVWWWYERRLG